MNPLSKKQRTDDGSVFKSLSEKFNKSESVDAEINDDLAGFVNNSFRSGIAEEKQTEMIKTVWAQLTVTVW